MPVVRFSPYAWAKLLWFRDHGNTEIAGYGIAHNIDDVLAVHDFQTVPQVAGSASAEFDDDGLETYYHDQADLDRQPCQFSRVWIHTHPGQNASPSVTDVATFAKSFGGCNWAVMVILGTEGATTARLHLSQPPAPRLQVELQTAVDYSMPFDASDQDAWLVEYDENITIETTGNQSIGAQQYGWAGYDWDAHQERAAAKQQGQKNKDWPQLPGAYVPRATAAACQDFTPAAAAAIAADEEELENWMRHNMH